MSPPTPETTILIRALNEERWLPDVFAALRRQRYRDFEVLLVDSGSVDATRDIAAANGARIVRLRTEDFTFGHSLNFGVQESRGSFVAILSAHAIPSDECWLEKLIAPLRRPEVAMVYGGQRGHAVSKFSESRDFERVFPDGPRHVHVDDPFANNANSAVKRQLSLEYPFDEGLPGLEDIDWAQHWLERNREVVYVPDACIIHVHTETWAQVRRRYYREAMAARWVGIRIFRHVPGEILREIAWCTHDLWLAARQGRLRQLAREILRFRFEKTVGTVKGIFDSKGLSNPARRAEIFLRKEFEAVVVRGPNRIQLEERVVPNLRPGELLVRVSHVGIGPSDLNVLDGKPGTARRNSPSYPIVPGQESSGTVVALGPRVTEFGEGDRVVVEHIQGCGECEECKRDEAIRCRDWREVGVSGQDGAFARYFVTRARYAHRVPADVPLAKATLTGPLAAVLKGLRRLGQSHRPMRCAVIGAGTTGHLAALVLAARGHRVTAFDPESAHLEALGGAVVTSRSWGDITPFEWFIETTGAAHTISKLLQEAPPAAAVLLLGQPPVDQMFGVAALLAHDRSIVGSIGSTRRDFDEALALLPSIDARPFLRAAYPLEQYEEAFATARSPMTLKVMLTADASAT
jgi:threonine dehydrogenase-like Zn-dependent dehydrogenase/glycosyltransferase involved in cell wall biosynthesis